MRRIRSGLVFPAAVAAVFVLQLGGCMLGKDRSIEPVAAPVVAAPEVAGQAGSPGPSPRAPSHPQPPIDLTKAGAVAVGSTDAEIIDTRLFAQQLGAVHADPGTRRRVREQIPDHGKPTPPVQGEPNALVAGGSMGVERAVPAVQFPGVNPTGWNPPDPSIAVGPNHVVSVVNQAIAFFTKAGVATFSAPLNSTGNPGFFETVGSGNFTFDLKCFYDHIAGRYVVVAPEYYQASQQAFICIAVSDDSDPNGVWYKYRTDAVVTVGTVTYWWDYPGFGYDANAYYVTSNLFGLNQSGWGGVGYRVFNKASMLSGGTAVYSTLRDGSSASVQVAQHFGTPQAPLFVSVASTSSLRVQAIRNPLTAPTISTTTVSVPAFSAPTQAPTDGTPVDMIDTRIMNAAWRNNRLYAAHTVTSGGKNMARWYEMNTGSWPTSGSVSLVHSGVVDGGTDVHSFFPAIYANAAGDVGLVVGLSSPATRVGVAVTGRRTTDPLGQVGAPTLIKAGESSVGGRWGDYYDIAVDPVDDTTFWVVGEYPRAGWWDTWIGSFRIGDVTAAHAVPDSLGVVLNQSPRTVDVLANDSHSTGLPMTIQSFDGASVRGGTITRSVGTGPGGRDQLVYTGPAPLNAADSFTYTITDGVGGTSTASVMATLMNPATFRSPDTPGRTVAGLDAAYYALAAPQTLPNFSLLTPQSTGFVSQVNYPSTTGVFAASGLSDNVGAVFTGYLSVPADDLYTLFLNSDEGSKLLIGQTVVVDNNGLHPMAERNGTIGLRAGLHALRIEYFEAASAAGLIAGMQGSSGSKQVISAASLRRTPACAADWDGNGAVDPSDIAAFVNTWLQDVGAGTVGADFDGSGAVEPADIAAYVNTWLTALSGGC